jgi:sec-independent protein translocase protein TatA
MSSTLFAFFTGMPGPMEMIIIGGIVLLLFGKRLPGAMRSLGSSVVEFKKGVSGIEDEVNGAVNKVVDEKPSNSNGDEPS